MTTAEGNQIIPNPERQVWTHFAWGNTANIMRVIKKVINKDYLRQQVMRFSQDFYSETEAGQYAKLRELHAFVRREIRYLPDPEGIQDIKHPARTWHDGYGDCKSMTVYVYFVCRCLDLPCFIRFTSYVDSGQIGHVYPVAILNGKQVIIDAVHDEFDAEVPYTNVEDRYSKVYSKSKIKQAMTMIREIAGIGKSTRGIDPEAVKAASMTMQQKGMLTLPVAPNYNILKSTEGMLLAQLKARRVDLLGRIAAARGDGFAADNNFRLRDQLLALGRTDLHSGRAGKISTYGLTNKMAADLKVFAQNIERRAYGASQGFKVQRSKSGIYGPYDIYDATPEQLAACEQFARQTTYGPNGPTGWIFNQTAYDNCVEGKFMENLVNDRLEKTGTNFLYRLMSNDNRFYSPITSKRIVQGVWLGAWAQVTGLSTSVLESYMDNGVIYDVEYDPQTLRVRLFPAMTSTQTQIGLDPATITAIAGLIATIISAVGAAVNNSKRVKSAVESRKQNAFAGVNGGGLSEIAPEEFDFNTSFGGNPGGGSNGSGGGMDNTTLIALGLGALLLVNN